MPSRRQAVMLSWVCASAVNVALADDLAHGELSTVTVLATREATSTLDVPASVSRVDGDVFQASAGVNLSEGLGSVPGLSVQNRGNYAQDLQLSIRGFGARSSFGARGIRLYADGIPATMPDGQGQYSHFDLSGADHLEVLRGPYSALYGNASGGVIAITTADSPAGPSAQASAAVGSDGLKRYAVRVGEGDPASNWVIDAAHFKTDGYRTHSAAARSTGNAKWRLDLTPRSRLTLVANLLATPEVQDPLGLTAAQLAADPTQAGSNAITYNTRKRVEQQQAGATLESTISDTDRLFISAYAGHRHSTQFQAILKSVEALPTHPGGVIDLDRRYRGGEWRIQDRRDVLGGPLTLTVGMTAESLDESRRGYLNFLGPILGVEGALRRDESNRASNVDEYAQAQWQLSSRWQVSGGVRHTDLKIDSVSNLNAAAPTTLRFGATTPVAGLTFRVQPQLAAYASFGRGFETPTLNDLAYRSTNGAVTGLNTDLRPARSNNAEVGLKWAGARLKATLAAFNIRNEDELAVKANSGGRSVLENIGPTRRRGAELSLEGSFSSTLSGVLAYTAIDARTLADYRACAATPCTPVTVVAGSRLPAVPRHALYTALRWQPRSDVSVMAETVGRAGIYADDRNLAYAHGYWSSNLVAQWTQQWADIRLTETARLDNVFDRAYVGSVIVNETNGRYYEPAAGRTALFMVTAAFR
jgi:iron complex outermembrane receptor protein